MLGSVQGPIGPANRRRQVVLSDRDTMAGRQQRRDLARRREAACDVELARNVHAA